MARTQIAGSILCCVVKALLGFVLAVSVYSAHATTHQTIYNATLNTLAGEQDVELPHALQKADFDREGSRVRYRMTVNVTDPSAETGIYIVKMSRSGRVFLNGQDVGSCGYFELEAMRCQHRPQFFQTNPAQWRMGVNTIEVEIYASYRQANGL